MSFLGGGWKTATARLGPSLRALLVRCGEGAVCEPCWRWKTVSFLVGSKSNVRHWGPLPAGLIRKIVQTATASFRVVSESNVRRRPGPSFRALLFGCGEGAVCHACVPLVLNKYGI